jgi:hypothetical protein
MFPRGIIFLFVNKSICLSTRLVDGSISLFVFQQCDTGYSSCGRKRQPAIIYCMLYLLKMHGNLFDMTIH